MADRAALRASVPGELELEPDVGDPFTIHAMDDKPDHADPDGVAGVAFSACGTGKP
jgi:hypothetical protein